MFHLGCSTLGVHRPTWPLLRGGTLDASLRLGGEGLVSQLSFWRGGVWAPKLTQCRAVYARRWLMVCRVFLPFVGFSRVFSFPRFCSFSLPVGLWDFPSLLLVCHERGLNPVPSTCETGAISLMLSCRGSIKHLKKL